MKHPTKSLSSWISSVESIVGNHETRNMGNQAYMTMMDLALRERCQHGMTEVSLESRL